MVLCSTAADAMKLKSPPENANPGDLVHCESYDRTPVETPRSKTKYF